MALVFGILAIVIGFIGCWLLGWVAFGIVAALGVVAICVTVVKNKNRAEGERKKVAGLVCGIIGIILALLMQMALVTIAKRIKEDLAKHPGEFPALESSVDKLEGTGIFGMVSSLADTGFSSDDLNRELEEYRKLLDSGNSALSTEAK